MYNTLLLKKKGYPTSEIKWNEEIVGTHNDEIYSQHLNIQQNQVFTGSNYYTGFYSQIITYIN